MAPEIAGRSQVVTCQQDALLAKQGPGGMREVFAPKASGAMELASLAADAPAGESALFSSVAGLLGSGGQASYSAANAVMDAWAAWQHIQVCVRGTMTAHTEAAAPWKCTCILHMPCKPCTRPCNGRPLKL